MVVCKDRLERFELSTKSAAEASARARDVNLAVESEINGLLKGKSYDQLAQLQRQIQSKLTSGEPIDVDYWEGLLKSLLVWKSRVSLYRFNHNPCISECFYFSIIRYACYRPISP
jgi:hypothetical protein